MGAEPPLTFCRHRRGPVATMGCYDMNRSRQRADTPKAIEDCHALLAWMLPQLDKFPRSRRFTLGNRI